MDAVEILGLVALGVVALCLIGFTLYIQAIMDEDRERMKKWRGASDKETDKREDE